MRMYELGSITVIQESYIVYVVNEEIENGQISVQDIVLSTMETGNLCLVMKA